MASRKESQKNVEDLARKIESLERFEAGLNQQIAEARDGIDRAIKLGDHPEPLERWLALEGKLLEQREHLEVIRGLVHKLLTPEVN